MASPEIIPLLLPTSCVYTLSPRYSVQFVDLGRDTGYRALSANSEIRAFSIVWEPAPPKFFEHEALYPALARAAHDALGKFSRRVHPQAEALLLGEML